MTEGIKKIEPRAPGPRKQPELCGHLEALEHDKGFGEIRKKLKAELEQRVNDLKRSSNDTEFLRLQGRIAALEWVIGLPDQIYKDAGGERKLFSDPEST